MQAAKSAQDDVGLRKISGLSLIETAIVLAVVGLVIGGIWIAAASYLSNLRINKAAENIMLAATNVRRTFGIYSYPTVAETSQFWTYEAIDAGLLPGDFKKLPLSAGVYEYAMDSHGLTIWVGAICRSHSPCPSLTIGGGLVGTSVYNGKLSPNECTVLVKRLAVLAQKDNAIYSIRIFSPAVVTYYPPMDITTFSCNASTDNIEIIFTP